MPTRRSSCWCVVGTVWTGAGEGGRGRGTGGEGRGAEYACVVSCTCGLPEMFLLLCVCGDGGGGEAGMGRGGLCVRGVTCMYASGDHLPGGVHVRFMHCRVFVQMIVNSSMRASFAHPNTQDSAGA